MELAETRRFESAEFHRNFFQKRLNRLRNAEHVPCGEFLSSRFIFREDRWSFGDIAPFFTGQEPCCLFAFTGKTLRRLPAGGFQFFPRFFKVPQEARR